MSLEPSQLIIAAAAALLIGISKTGVPGVGILVVPMLANVFGGWRSVGITLLMLIVADCFAVFYYHRHAQWDKLVRLLPWVVAGMIGGVGVLWMIGRSGSEKDFLNPVIGAVVISMLALYLLQERLGPKLSPKSRIGTCSTGAAAGFVTTISNAAGPIMTVYLSAHRLPKEQFMGTIAWYFFVINLTKVPVYLAMSAINPAKPMLTLQSLTYALMACPVIIIGVVIGLRILPRISQKAFTATILILAALSAVKLFVG